MFKALELVINQRQLMPIRIGAMMPILKVICIRLADVECQLVVMIKAYIHGMQVLLNLGRLIYSRSIL